MVSNPRIIIKHIRKRELPAPKENLKNSWNLHLSISWKRKLPAPFRKSKAFFKNYICRTPHSLETFSKTGTAGPPNKNPKHFWKLHLSIPENENCRALGESLGTFGDVLRSLGDALVHSLGPLRSSFGHFRCLFGILWGQLGAPKGSLRLSKGAQEGSWGHLGITLEASKRFAKQFAAICKNLQIYCKVLQKSRSEESEFVENLTTLC